MRNTIYLWCKGNICQNYIFNHASTVALMMAVWICLPVGQSTTLDQTEMLGWWGWRDALEDAARRRALLLVDYG